ncbi:MAG: hypothetical protein KatS3mg102_2269 [Planctomycetota bacterium]|nr:MAG: hypothetical protein KatS3mg102_2269 [Planctomycetota bacterium]
MLPGLYRRLQELVAALGARYVLEIGPGNRPLVRGPGVTYLDVSHALLLPLGGQRVEGDLLAAPFLDGVFDLVIAADVLTHVPPARRAAAIDELRRLAPQLLLFHPEPGGGALAPPLGAEELAALVRARGLEVELWPVHLPGPRGLLRFGILLAHARSERAPAGPGGPVA